MPRTPINGVLDFLHGAALLQQADATDGDLLGRYVARRDEAAFATLVRRHGPMILGVCRRLLPHPQDAEDAFQAVFLVLVRKAASVRPRDRLAGWLYGVARKAALKARQAVARRRAREKQVKALPEPATVAEGIWRDLLPLLDGEVVRLPEKYRLPVVLCDLEGRTRNEAARQLGWPEGTVAGRLARARTLLAKRLTRRGVPASTGVLAAVLSQNPASSAVPLALIFSTIKTTAGAGAVSAPVAALTQGVLNAMLWTKVQFAAVILLGAAALCGGAVFFAQPSALSRPTGAAKDAPLSPGVAAKDAEVDSPPATVRFVRKRDGKPPMQFFDVSLELRNTADHPVWLLIPYYGDYRLPRDGTFKSSFDQPFGGQEYDGAAKGGRGKAVEVHFHGDPSFRAFYLPAKATVTFDDFTVETWSDISEVEFGEASSLLVNGRTPLEKWLPYPTLSDATAVVRAGTDWKNLDWDPVKSADRTDYPKEPVKTVTAAVRKKWTVPISGVDKGDGK